jgi:transposase InsO family protein
LPYTTNPYAPKARMMARNDVVRGRLTVSQAALKYGVNRSTIWRWIEAVKTRHLNGNTYLWTLSSAPHRHPNEVNPEVVDRILKARKTLNRCAPIIHAHLKSKGIKVSLSTVERILRKHKLTRRRKQLKDYTPIPRPLVLAPGHLIQADTIHFVNQNFERSYVYSVIDLFSRFGYAEYHNSISYKVSFRVLLHAQEYFGFPFQTIQTDHGSEFSPRLTYLLKGENITLRHSRIRKPNDNAHIERFNRTLQEECFKSKLPNYKTAHNQLKKYINFYNYRRLHLSLGCQTPADFVAKVLK